MSHQTNNHRVLRSGIGQLALVLLVWTGLSGTCLGQTSQEDLLQALLERVQALEDANAELQRQVQLLQHAPVNPPPTQLSEQPDSGFAASPLAERILISGEGGVAYFHSESDGAYENGDFRVDEARLFMDVKLLDEAFLFTELTLTTREQADANVEVGELFVDFEGVGDRWIGEDVLSLRIGRMDIPFGEEYLYRDAIDNPLISHSISDLWGIDEGVAGYGVLGGVDYIVAVQNGGHPSLEDGNGDKSVTARIGTHPVPDLRVSVSAMRTGDLDVEQDRLSELWFGDGFIRAIGDRETTTEFRAELVEADIRWAGERTSLAGAVGHLWTDDNDSTANHQTDSTYYLVEAVTRLLGDLYGAARFSHVLSDRGLPIVGQAPFSTFFQDTLTDELWRLSLGLGYRLSAQCRLKAEYSTEQGEDRDGNKLDHRDQVSAEIAFRF